MKNCRFESNKAVASGAIYWEGVNLNIENSVFARNENSKISTIFFNHISNDSEASNITSALMINN